LRARARLRFARTETPPEPVTRGAASSDASGGDTTAELRRVAEKHAPDGGYGETAWNEGEGTVFWVPADWTSNEEMDAAHSDFMEIDGVNGVVGDAESRWPDGEGWEQVWPVPGSEQAYERVLALAMRPLEVNDAYVAVRPDTNGFKDDRVRLAERVLDSIDGAVRLARRDETA
jgi:hypothetical protein